MTNKKPLWMSPLPKRKWAYQTKSGSTCHLIQRIFYKYSSLENNNNKNSGKLFCMRLPLPVRLSCARCRKEGSIRRHNVSVGTCDF